MPKDSRTKKVISILLVLIFLSGLVAGCSSKASAKVDEKLELAVKYLSEQKYEEAILAYQEVIKIDSKNVTAYKGISLAYTLQEKPDQAEQALQDGLKAIPQNTQLQLAMAGLMLDQGKADQAEAIYKELINVDSPTLSSYQAYTYYLNQQGRAAEAIALLEQAIAKNNQDYRLNSMLAELYLKNGDKEKALAAINKSMAAQLDQSTSYRLLAEMYKDKWAELIALGDQYIQQNQTKTGQLLKLSGLLGMGKYDDVIKLYGELAVDLKDNTRARFIAAQASTKLGSKDQSIELLKPIKLAELKEAGMLADLANYYLEIGDKENARKLAKQGIWADETAIENYTVMFKSYAGEDKSLAQIWALKYLLAGVLSYEDGLSQLAGSGFELSFLKRSENELTSTEIVKWIVKDQAVAEKELKIMPDILEVDGAEYYLDTKNNIAYRGYCEKDTNWKPIIERYHSPTIYNKDNIPAHVIDNINRIYRDRGGFSQYLSENREYAKFILVLTNTRSDRSYAAVSLDYVCPVSIEGEISIEEHFNRAGYPIENITFRDVYK